MVDSASGAGYPNEGCPSRGDDLHASGSAKALLPLVRETWSALEPPLRRLCQLLAGIGFVLLLAGIAADVLGAWGPLSYSTNIVAGVTTAAFGVPLAVLVLGALYAQQAEHDRQGKVRRLRAAAVYDLKYSAAFLYEVDEQGLRDLVQSVRDSLIQISSMADLLRRSRAPHASIDRSNRRRMREVVVTYVDLLRVDQGKLQRVVGSIRKVEDRWSGLCDKWQLLGREVRIQVYEEGMTWLESECDDALRRSLRADLQSPLLPFAVLAEHLSEFLIEMDVLLSAPDFPKSDDIWHEASPLRRDPILIAVDAFDSELARICDIKEAVGEAVTVLAVEPLWRNRPS